MSEKHDIKHGRTNVAAKITQDLREKIESGVYIAGQKLPSRRILAEEYGVAVVTLERALAPLFADGLLHANDRSATYVAGNYKARSFNKSITIIYSLPKADDTIEALSRTVWYREIVTSAINVAAESSIEIKLYNRESPSHVVNGEAVSIKDAVQYAIKDGSSGIIYLSLVTMIHPDEEGLDIMEAVKETALPAVFICPRPIINPVSHVFYDQNFACYDAVQCLLDTGCREIIYYQPWAGWWVTDRELGIRAALQGRNIQMSVFPAIANEISNDEKDVMAFQAADEVLDKGIVGAGIIAANDVAAQGLIRAAMPRGLIAGRDFSIIGFDDHPDSQYYGLSTLKPPVYSLGAESVLLLLRMINKQSGFVQLRLRSDIIHRTSTSMKHS